MIKLSAIALAMVATLTLSLSLRLAVKADEPSQPCQGYLDSSNNVDPEVNNCPITVEEFSIRGTFSNSNWQASFWAYEPAYYILYVQNKLDGTTINLTGFNVMGTTNRPQYQFTNSEQNVTYRVTFRYSDPNLIRLEIYQDNRAIVNELLTRESDQLLGGP